MPQPTTGAFTLVELLIVISVIAILASVAVGGIIIARERTYEAMTRTDVTSLDTAAEHFYQDEGAYPGQTQRVPEDGNQFPRLFDALFGERIPLGPGGRNAPYAPMKEERIAVYDVHLAAFRPASRQEMNAAHVDKFVLDVWGNPFVYRANKGRERQAVMRNRYRFDLYSTGPDGIDQTAAGDAGSSDDIGNW